MAKGRYREVPVFYPLPETPAYHGPDGVQTVAEFGIHERNGREYVHEPVEPEVSDECIWEVDETEFDVFSERLKFTFVCYSCGNTRDGEVSIWDIPWPDTEGPCIAYPAGTKGGEEDETDEH